jgi:hypothetical protein
MRLRFKIYSRATCTRTRCAPVNARRAAWASREFLFLFSISGLPSLERNRSRSSIRCSSGSCLVKSEAFNFWLETSLNWFTRFCDSQTCCVLQNLASHASCGSDGAKFASLRVVYRSGKARIVKRQDSGHDSRIARGYSSQFQGSSGGAPRNDFGCINARLYARPETTFKCCRLHFREVRQGRPCPF